MGWGMADWLDKEELAGEWLTSWIREERARVWLTSWIRKNGLETREWMHSWIKEDY